MNYSLNCDNGVVIRRFTSTDYEALFVYYNSLAAISKHRFAPHRFDREGIGLTFSTTNDLLGYVSIDSNSSLIVGYAVCKLGFFTHDRSRFESYGCHLNGYTDCFYAPSVLDDWHGRGLGKEMFYYILDDLKLRNIKRIFLWGGVKHSNESAVKFYERLGFVSIGDFEHEGANRDMVYMV